MLRGRWTEVHTWWSFGQSEGQMQFEACYSNHPGHLGWASMSDNYIKNGSSAGRAWSRDQQKSRDLLNSTLAPTSHQCRVVSRDQSRGAVQRTHTSPHPQSVPNPNHPPLTIKTDPPKGCPGPSWAPGLDLGGYFPTPEWLLLSGQSWIT